MAGMSITNKFSKDIGNPAKSQKTMKLLDKLIERKLEFDKKYQMVDMTDLVKENCQNEDQIKRVISCLEVLAKYCDNLLNPEALRPQKWMAISLHNQIFLEKVQPVKGHRKILEQIGYKKEERGALIHEGEDVLNVYVIAQVYLELKAIQQELKLWVEGKHPFHELFEGLLENSSITLTKENAKLFSKQLKEELKTPHQEEQLRRQQPPQQQQQPQKPVNAERDGRNFTEIKQTNDKQPNDGEKYPEFKNFNSGRTERGKTDPSQKTKRTGVIFYSTMVIEDWICDHCTSSNVHGDKPCRMKDRPNILDLQMQRRKLPHTCQVCYKTTEVFCPLEIKFLVKSRKSIMPEGMSLLPPLSQQEFLANEACSEGGVCDFESEMKRLESRKVHETKLLWNNRFQYFIKTLHKEVGQMSEEEIQYLFSTLHSKLPSDSANLILQNYHLAVFDVLQEWKAAELKTLELLKSYKVYMDKTNGEGSLRLVRACLAEASGNPILACEKFTAKWKNLLQTLKEECFIPELPDDNYSDALFKCAGNVEEAKMCLIKNRYTYVIYGQEDTKTEMANDLYRDMRLFDPKVNKAIRDKGVPMDKRVRMLMCECDIDDCKMAKQVISLMDSSTNGENLCIVDFLEALEEKNSIREAGRQLVKMCTICAANKPLRSFLKIPKCGCMVCMQCTKTHFEIRIRGESISSIVCPMCSKPKIDDSYSDLDFFPPLMKLLSNILDEGTMNSLAVKLTMWTLKDERVIRCPWGCGEQFIVDNINLRVVKCPKCMKSLCINCCNKWENSQHDCNSTNKNTDIPSMNLKSCPRCRQPFYLVKGGCLHMTCTKCSHQFCVGCEEPFLRKGCNFSEECPSLGFHCHHPRNCHYYMRDKPAKELLSLLQVYDVKIIERPHDHYPPQPASLPALPQATSSDLDRPTLARSKSVCMSPIQKTDNGSEEICGQDLFHEELQLCCNHFVEYLCDIIKGKELDPLYIMSEGELECYLTRHRIKVPKVADISGDYRTQLIKIAQDRLPLKRHQPAVVLRRNTISRGS